MERELGSLLFLRSKKAQPTDIRPFGFFSGERNNMEAFCRGRFELF